VYTWRRFPNCASTSVAKISVTGFKLDPYRRGLSYKHKIHASMVSFTNCKLCHQIIDIPGTILKILRKLRDISKEREENQSQ
jgi:hypothetical protein